MDSLMKEIHAILKVDTNQYSPSEQEICEIFGCISEKFGQSEELIHKINQMKYQTILDLEKRKADISYFKTRLGNRYYWDRDGYVANQKKSRLHYLQQALAELQQSTLEGKNRMRQRKVQELYLRMQHGNKNLAEERRIMREIKRRKEQSENPSSDADERRTQNYYWWCYGYIPDTEEGLNDEIKLISHELQELQKKRKPVFIYEEKLRKDLKEAEKDAGFLQKQMDMINKTKRQLYAFILDLRKQMNGKFS